MRYNFSLLIIIIGGAAWLAASRAEATSCGPPGFDTGDLDWSLYDDSVQEDLPVDAQPWQRVGCWEEPLDESTCELVREEGELEVVSAVDVEEDGVCPEERGGQRSFVRRFIPAEPLVAGASYWVRCGKGSVHQFTVRADEVEALAAEELVVDSVEYRRGDDSGCCSVGDYVDLRLAAMDSGYLDEGGYIELAYPEGQRYAITSMDNDEYYMLPATHGPIVLTPVAADGLRGDAVVLADFDEDLVYLPCKSSVRPGPLAPWLLLPFAWIFAHGRRRRAV